MKRYKLLQEKRENIIKIARKHGAFNILIFGSVARGEDSNDSDIDFLVEMEQGRNLLDRIERIESYTQERKDRFYQSLLIQSSNYCQ